MKGGLYSTQNDDGGVVIVKILKMEDQGVHVRVYSNRLDSHPSEFDETTLYLRGVDREPGEELGMGHLPLSRESFAAWRPQFIKRVAVEEAELEGYKMWSEASGGFF